VTESRRQRLDRLTDRWRARHEARMVEEGRPRADPEREARARASFPWKTQSAAEYAATYGSAMVGYTYDAYSYEDGELEAWLRQLGDLLRARGRRC
jgi:hypothetical protein